MKDPQDAEIEAVLLEAKDKTKSPDKRVQLLWTIQGLALGNFTLEQTQRYVASQLVRGFKVIAEDSNEPVAVRPNNKPKSKLGRSRPSIK